MSVDVVVVNYRTPEMLKAFIDSYEEFKFPGCTLAIMDVDPQTGCLERFRADWYYLFRDNIGYGRACNVGATLGTNDVILLANADTVLTKGFVECYDALVSTLEWGVLGPRQVNTDGVITAGGILGTDQALYQRAWREFDHGQCDDIREDAISVSGALYFIKRALWEELTDCPQYRAFDPNAAGAFLETTLYYEETFCSYHARAHGSRCVFYGPVQMIHHWHGSVGLPGGWTDQQMPLSLERHRQACAAHSIVCE